MWLETTQKGKGAKKGEWTGESRKGLPLHLLLRALLPPLPPPSTLLFALSNTRFRIRPVWNLQLSSTSVSIRFAGFDAVTLANNHLNDFGEKGANFTCEVLKKTGVKYIGVTYGKYDTSQVSITCSDIQHWYKPEMLPISVKLLRRLCTSKRFSVLFSLLYVVYSSPKFLFRGLRIHLPPPPPISAPPPMSYFIGNFPWVPDCKTARVFTLAQNARLQAGKGKVWTEGKNGEWVWRLARLILRKKNSTVLQSTGAAMMNTFVSDLSLVTVPLSHSWRSTWSTSFLPLVLPWILFMVWFFFSLFISLAKVLNLHYYFPSIAGSLSSFFII